MVNKAVFRDFPFKSQEFTQYEDEYFLNRDGELELYPAKKDCQAYIDSQVETVFQKMLEALMQPVESSINEASDFIANRESAATDLDAMIEADQVFENVRLEHPELKGASRAQVVKYLRDQISKEYKKEGNVSETNSSSQTGEQKEFPPDGAQNSQ